MTDAAVTDSLLGQQLDEYRLETLLGQGGMARVYGGFDVRLKRPVAVKVIHTAFRTTPDYQARFEREAQALARLKHPHVVSIYRYGQLDELLYVAMEYIEGTDLQKLLAAYHDRGELLPPAEVGRLIRQVCQALDYIHSQNIIHRDVKPSNIMLDRQGQAVVTDFGLVLLTELGTQGGLLGTPQYMAPEQAGSSAWAVPQSDLYAVGVILYEMFTGKLPFEGLSALEIARMQMEEPPPAPRVINPDLSPALEAVILKALAKEPQNRYPSGAALAEALNEALRRTPQEAREQLTERNQTLIKRYRLKDIRALLLEGFTAEDLRRLCFDELNFRPVYYQLADNTGKAEIVDRLLEYAEQTLQLDYLLALAQAGNPARYAQGEPYYEQIAAGPENLVPKTLGHEYNLIERLGQGAMAAVYKASQMSLSRYVAVKILHAHLVYDNQEDFVERFEREAIAVASLNHPNIVQVFDYGREDELHYIVMRFIDGPTLQAELEKHRRTGELFPLTKTLALFKALASAIDYAHQRGIVHRDLKPGNMMLDEGDQVVLTDFGIARLANVPGHTVTNAVVGTPAYMSPEQAQGHRVDGRSDIYSLGVILYELTTGRLPFEGDTPLAVFLKHISEPAPRPTTINPNLPPAIEKVILTALNKNPEERYRTAGAMAQALEETPAEKPEPLPDEFSYDAFISVSEADRAWVFKEVLPRLEKAGLRVCLDFRDFDRGAQWLHEVERAVLTSRKTLAVLTPAYLANEWAELEYTLARSLDPASRRRRLIPLLKEKCELPLSLRFLVPVDFVEPIDPDFPWTQLLGALGRR